ncbi:hypothetical protein CR513_33241, partial [Mucuna pruriens]
MVEKQCGWSIKVLRTDGGGEYTSHDFHSYCDKEGIILEVTAPYNPQHNEKAKRKNRTLMNMTQCMPKAYIILNRSPTKSLHDVTLEEARSKLDDRRQAMMFLGYDSTGAYKLYNSISKKIVLSKDVDVDESKCWRWETTIESDKVTIPIQLDEG